MKPNCIIASLKACGAIFHDDHDDHEVWLRRDLFEAECWSGTCRTDGNIRVSVVHELIATLSPIWVVKAFFRMIEEDDTQICCDGLNLYCHCFWGSWDRQMDAKQTLDAMQGHSGTPPEINNGCQINEYTQDIAPRCSMTELAIQIHPCVGFPFVRSTGPWNFEVVGNFACSKIHSSMTTALDGCG